MKKETLRNISLGTFVIVGTVLLILALYMIGNKQNIFGSTFTIHARFNNVSGLMVGNTIRLAGIDIGTIEEVTLVNDSLVDVTMLIKKNVKSLIRKNARASLGTDGLMGNRLINITPSTEPSQLIEEGDRLETISAVETERLLRTIEQTNENALTISENIKSITQRVSNPNTFWSILADTVMAENMQQAILNLRLTGERSAVITKDVSNILQNFRPEKKSVVSLLSDTLLSRELRLALYNMKTTSDSMAIISANLASVTRKIKAGQGAAGTLLYDSTFSTNMVQSMENIKKGTAAFNENMEALHRNFLFRKYFKEKK